jgi:S-methylmethionine-dependent homocysteine/selenocysteine methylase
MHSYRQRLPQLDKGLFLTDGGLETTLVFHHGVELPEFAAFDLLKNQCGTALLTDYFRSYIEIARQHGLGFILESATWRANPDWAAVIGYDQGSLDVMNGRAVQMLHELRAESQPDLAMVISGCVGPRDDGYNPANVMTAACAEQYHARQIRVFDGAGVDMISAVTMTNVPEAVGITRSAAARGIPVAISFTVETDGRLPTGEPLGEAIATVDAQTSGRPAYYMVNCAHPSHFENQLDGRYSWVRRILGIRANASRCSHEELDAARELDEGDPQELGENYRQLLKRLPHLRVLGGCCGTDLRHISAIADACGTLYDPSDTKLAVGA